MIFLTRVCRGARSFGCAWAIIASSTPSTSAATNSHSLRSATGGKSIAFDSFIAAGEIRGQFQAIQNTFDDLRARLIAVTPLGLTVSNPPTQAEVPALADKLDELIASLNG